ncbi:MAG: hypothetical protein JJ934_02005 [Pseudomonadales bacterium]|nr:hypothetical protein [Pseudomonadales bacterium]
MKRKFLLALFFLGLTSGAIANPDLRPPKVSDQDYQLGNDRASQERAKREHAARMERERVRSQAEREIDSYQGTKVRGSISEGGGSITGSKSIP